MGLIKANNPDDVVATSSDGMNFVYCDACEGVHGFDSRWTFNGDVKKPTFSPSMLVTRPWKTQKYVCHSFVRDGKMEYLSDCTHKLAGQTVNLKMEMDWYEEEMEEKT